MDTDDWLMNAVGQVWLYNAKKKKKKIKNKKKIKKKKKIAFTFHLN